MRVVFHANAIYNDITYQTKNIYNIDNDIYENVKQSCSICTEEKQHGIKIIVIQTHGIGNCVNATAVINILHEHYHVKIDVLFQRHCHDIVSGWDAVGELYDLENIPELSGYDVVFQCAPQNMAFVSSLLITPDSEELKTYHEVETNIRALSRLGIDYEHYEKKTHVQRDDCGLPAGKYIGICSGCIDQPQWIKKQWGYKNYADLISLLRKQYTGYKFLIFGAGKDCGVLQHVKDKRNVINCVDKYTLSQTADAMAQCKFIISNDTGPGHIAAAVGVHVFSIFGSTLISKNVPWGNCTVIRSNIDCSPCQYTPAFYTCKDYKCMKAITVDKVYSVIDDYYKDERKQYKLGIVMVTCARYDTLIATLTSLYNTGITGTKIVIVDDASNDAHIEDMINNYKCKLIKLGNMVQIIRHGRRYGKNRFCDTLTDGIKACSNCDYIFFMPDDIIINPYIFEVIKKAYTIIKEKVAVITFFIDSRTSKYKLYTVGKPYKKYYNIINAIDGFLCLFKRDIFDGIELKSCSDKSGSGTWTNLCRKLNLKDYFFLQFNECLGEHIGNLSSMMNTNERNLRKIYGIDVNIIDKPKILNDRHKRNRHKI